MLNEHCVRLESGFRLSHPTALGRLLLRRKWTDAQKMLLGQPHVGLVGARARRQQLRHYMAQEILAEKELLRLTRLCGISLITLYGLIAAIGDINRFSNARKLCVAVWHVMQGHAIGAIERLDTLHTKLRKLATELGLPSIKQLGYETKEAFVQKKLYLLRSYP